MLTLQAFLPSADERKFVRIQVYEKADRLRDAIVKYMAVGEEVADRVDADAEGIQLAGIIRLKARLLEAIEKYDAAAQPSLDVTHVIQAADADTDPRATLPSVQELLTKAENIIADAVHASSGQHKTILQRLLDDCGP